MKNLAVFLIPFLLWQICPAQTQLNTGDLAVVTFNADGDDVFSFVTFVDLTPGTQILLTDNGFERAVAANVRTYTFGNTEELLQLEVTGSTIPAGTVITYDKTLPAPYTSPSNFIHTKLQPSIGSPYMDQFTASGDGLFLLQGTWANGTSGMQNAVFTGTYIWGFNGKPWQSDAVFASSTAESRLPPELYCANGAFPHVDNFQYMDSAPKTGDYGTLIAALLNPANWASDNTNPFPPTLGPFTVTGGFSTATWTGAVDTDWFNCANWDNLKVPNATVDAIFPTGAANDIILQPGDTAICRDLTLTGGTANRFRAEGDPSKVLEVHGNLNLNTSPGSGALDFSDGIAGTPDGHIYLYGDWNNTSGAPDFDEGQSVLYFVGNGPQSVNVSPQTLEAFGSMVIAKPTGEVLLGDNVQVQDTLSLLNGLLTTGPNYAYVSNDIQGAIPNFGPTSWVNGNLRREISPSGGFYSFPVGSAIFPELAGVQLGAGNGIGTLRAAFNTAIGGSPPALLEAAVNYDEMLNAGVWDIAPVTGSLVGVYNLLLAQTGYSNGGAPSYIAVKRNNPASPWTNPGIDLGWLESGGVVTAQRGGLTAFSEFGIARPTVLPVILSYFEANPLPTGMVQLAFGIEGEVNVDSYVVERVEGTDFMEISRMAAEGKGDYLAYDQQPAPGWNEYRLLELTNNGEYFEVARAEAYFEPVPGNNWTVYPNPFRDQFAISGAEDASAHLDAELMALDGRVICAVSGPLDAVNARLSGFVGDLPAGIYLLRIRDGQSAWTGKVVKE